MSERTPDGRRPMDCGGTHHGQHRSKPLDHSTGRIGHTCLICDVDVVHTCDCAMNDLLCPEATPRGFHPTRIEQLN